MDSSPVTDDHEPRGGRMDPASPRFMWGWRRFTANVVRESIASARFIAAFSLRHKRPGQGYKPRLAGRVANGCAAWMWVLGRGNKDFTFNECCEINGLESCFAIRAVLDILTDSEDIKRVDRWVEEHCRITGCLLPGWGGEGPEY